MIGRLARLAAVLAMILAFAHAANSAPILVDGFEPQIGPGWQKGPWAQDHGDSLVNDWDPAKPDTPSHIRTTTTST
jgi:hypothetical protein